MQGPVMPWFYLLVAIALEVCGTVSLKLTEGFTKPLYIGFTAVFYLTSFVFLAQALKFISVGTAYAIWSGFGTALVALIGFWYFKEPMSALKLACLGLIVIGVIGLHLAENSPTHG